MLKLHQLFVFFLNPCHHFFNAFSIFLCPTHTHTTPFVCSSMVISMVICRIHAHMLSYRAWGEVGQWPRRLMQRSVWGYYIARATEAGVILRSNWTVRQCHTLLQACTQAHTDTQISTLSHCCCIDGGKMCHNFSCEGWKTSGIISAIIINGGITGRFRFDICCHYTLFPIEGALVSAK